MKAGRDCGDIGCMDARVARSFHSARAVRAPAAPAEEHGPSGAQILRPADLVGVRRTVTPWSRMAVHRLVKRDVLGTPIEASIEANGVEGRNGPGIRVRSSDRIGLCVAG